MPLISIVVPVYNVEKYLEKCVNSILSQTFNDFELILVDDGSPDNCGKICDSFAQKDSRVVVVHKENNGLSAARNSGIEIAKGKYIGFIDSDDYIAEDMYEILYNNIQKESADISMCALYDCYAGKDIELNPKPEYLVVDSKEAIKIVFEAKITSVTAVNKLYKIELFNDIKYPVGKSSEDAFVIVDLLHASKKIVITTEEKYFYIHRENSITSSTYKKNDLLAIEAYENNYKKIMEFYPNLEKVARMRVCWANFYVLDKIMLTKDFTEKTIEKKIIHLLRSQFTFIMKCKDFTRGRKLSMLGLMINKNIYRLFVLSNNRVNKKLY